MVGPDVMVLVLPRPQRRLAREPREIAIIAFPELAAGGAGGPFDVPVALGRAWREDEPRPPPLLAGGLERGPERGPARGRHRPAGEGSSLRHVGAEAAGGAGGGAGTDPGHAGAGGDRDGGAPASVPPGRGVRGLVSGGTRSPGCSPGSSFGWRTAQGRAWRRVGRRGVGSGAFRTPRRCRSARMRPSRETERGRPSRCRRTARWSFPQRGSRSRACRTAAAWAAVPVGRRHRVGRGERCSRQARWVGSSRRCQREQVDRAIPQWRQAAATAWVRADASIGTRCLASRRNPGASGRGAAACGIRSRRQTRVPEPTWAKRRRSRRGALGPRGPPATWRITTSPSRRIRPLVFSPRL